MSGINLNNVTLLITHFNRTKSLTRLLNSFKNLDMIFSEIIVSDDNSDLNARKELLELQKEHNFNLIQTDQNKGLGNNINKGQSQVQTPYTLYIQEDFFPKEKFKGVIEAAIQLMEKSNDIDIVRFYAYGRYPYLRPYSEKFYEMKFSLTLPGYKKFYYYSDHPHLKRRSFIDKFGRYAEGYNPEQTEYRMMMSFLQNKGKGIFYYDHKELFEHFNSSEEPSTMKRVNWRRSKFFIIAFTRDIYRHLKFNSDYLFGDFRNL